MTELLSGVEAPSDAELISRVRGGDVAAYGQLFSRHVDAARRLGRQLVRGHDVDDLVSDAFAKTLQVLQAGGGPDVAFRAYLLTSVRRLHVDRIRAAKKVQPTDDMSVYDDGLPFQDTAVASFENGAAAKAFSSLPERWQLVLWHLEVEGQKPADIAPLLGMSANSVSALAYRAREGLRQAFLTMHLADCPTEECRWVNEHLGAYVRKGLARRDTTKVEQHLDGCRRCTAMYLELNEVNSNLAGIIAPLLLGAAAAGYISSAGGAGLTGVSAFFGRIRDAVGANSGGASAGGAGSAGSAASAGGAAAASGVAAGSAVTAGGLITAGGVIAAGVAAVTTAAFVFGGAPKDVVTDADQQVGIVQTPPIAGGGDAGSEDETGDSDAAEDGPGGPTDTTLITPDESAQDAEAPAGVEAAAPPAEQPGSGTDQGTAPGPGDGTAGEPGTGPNDGPDDSPDGPNDGQNDGPGDNPGDGPLDGVPQVDIPLPPADSPVPPVKKPGTTPDDTPGDGTVTDPAPADDGAVTNPLPDDGDGDGGTVTNPPPDDGGSLPDTEGGPGRSDGTKGTGNDNIPPPSNNGAGEGNQKNSVDAQANQLDGGTVPDSTATTDGGPSQTDGSGQADDSGETGGSGQAGDATGGSGQPDDPSGQTGGSGGTATDPDAGQDPNAGQGSTGGQQNDVPGSGTTQPPASPVQTTLEVTPTIDDGVLLLDIKGDPLPDEVTVALTSDPAGITFAEGGSCELAEPSEADGPSTTATCSTAPDFLGTGLFGLRAVTESTAPSQLRIPLHIPADLQSASLTLTVASADENVSGETSAVLEYEVVEAEQPGVEESGEVEEPADPDETKESDETQEPLDDEADVSDGFGFVGDPEVTASEAGGAHRYTVRVRLKGVVEGDQVRLTLRDNDLADSPVAKGVWFCEQEDCSPAGSQTLTFLVSGTEGRYDDDEDEIVVDYEFDVWLPGRDKSVFVEGLLEGAGPSSRELVSSEDKGAGKR